MGGYEKEDAASALALFSHRVRFESLSPEVLERVRLLLADHYASMYAGMVVNSEANQVVCAAVRNEGGSSQATFAGGAEKIPASQAAYLNAFLAHGADIDDGNRWSAGHIGAHVFSSVLALAEREGSSWEAVAEAVVVGYEVFNRVASSAQPGLYNRGFHATGVTGSIASAAACAKLLGLRKEGIYDSIALGALQSSGLIIVDESAQETKPLNAANASRLGLLSAVMAQNGLKGPSNPLNHPRKGWFAAFSDSWDIVDIFKDFEQKCTILDTYIKAYPSCRHTHCVADAALELRTAISKRFGSFDPLRIDSVHVRIYPHAIRSAGVIRIPTTSQESKFSISYVLATALCEGGFFLRSLDPDKAPSLVFDVERKIDIVSDASLEDRKLGIRGACVSVSYEGVNFLSRVLVPKGEKGGASFGWKDMREKMHMCTESFMSKADADVLVDGVKNLSFAGKYTPVLNRSDLLRGREVR